MQDDTLGIAQCGFKGRKMNNFLNTRTNIMGLQFGRLKCEKMHIGKKKVNADCCVEFEVDSWNDKHSFLAASLMRDAMLLGGMLFNSEA